MFPDEGNLDLIFTLRHMDTIARENSAILKMSKGSVPKATSSLPVRCSAVGTKSCQENCWLNLAAS